MGDVPDFLLNNPCIVREWLCYTRRRPLLALWDAVTAVGKSLTVPRRAGEWASRYWF